MNTSGRTAFQVGLLVCVAIILFVGGWIFFNGQIRKESTYGLTFLFHDAQGIQKQANVFLAGVKIGTVDSVGLTPDNTGAEIHALIQKKYSVPAGSTIVVSASLLGGSAAVNIVPPPPGSVAPNSGFIAEGSTVRGQDALGFEALQAQAGGLLAQVNKTAAKADMLIDQATQTTSSINRMLNDPRLSGSLFQTVNNLNVATQQGVQLTKELQGVLNQDNGKISSALGHVDNTAAQFDDLASQNRGKIQDIIGQLDSTTTQLASLSNQANQTLTQGKTMQNLSDTVANLKEATVKLNSIETDISHLSSDPQVQSDLKTTLHNTAVASGNASKLIDRLAALTGGHPGVQGPGSLKFQSRLDFTQNFRSNKFRTDFDLYAPFSSLDFARIGVYDLTEDNRLNLQYGTKSPYNNLLTYRAGIYAGKVGVGADYDLFGNRTLSFDLYDPNRLRLDARQRFRLNKQSSVWVGVEDVPRTNGVTLGFELQR